MTRQSAARRRQRARFDRVQDRPGARCGDMQRSPRHAEQGCGQWFNGFALSFTCWDPAARDLWIREQDPIGIKQNPCGPQDRYAYISKHMHAHCGVAGKKHVGVLIGLRIVESPMRRLLLSAGGAAYKHIKWCHKRLIENTRTFWPIYDFTDQDVWVCIAKNDLPYNRIYDAYFRYGIPRTRMRVSFLIHETSCLHDIPILQEVEPETYDRFVRRIPGVSTLGHLADDIVPKTLPAAFADWREYRDYLLDNLVESGNREIFKKLWRGQESEDWYKEHVRGVVINDIDSTKLHAKEIVFDQKLGTDGRRQRIRGRGRGL